MVSVSRVLREVFGSWRGEVTGEWNLIICRLLAQNHSRNEVKENEADCACGKYSGEDKYIQDFGGES